MSGLFSLTAVLIRRGESPGDDGYGNALPGVPDREPWAAFWEPRESGEATTAQNQVTSGYWVALEGQPDLSAVDAIELDGLEYEIDGEPGRVPGGFTLPSFTKLAAKRVTG